jgi:hypothetical protein
MSEITEKEFASAIKWIVVIIVAAFAYSKVAPNYHFSKFGMPACRSHKVTGLCEYSDDGEWVSFVEKETDTVLRKRRRNREIVRANDLKKTLTQIEKDSDDEKENNQVPDFFAEIEKAQKKSN